MKYFIDTEFLEGPQKEKFPISLFRKETPPTIDLISIGIVAEDGREYYAISKDFNLKEAWNRFQLEQQSGDMRNLFPKGKKVYWIRDNVLKPIFDELYWKDTIRLSDHKRRLGWAPDCILKLCYDDLRYLINMYGKTNKEIAEEVFQFCNNDTLSIEKAKYYNVKYPDIEFYAYYADYDWVVSCWLFGKMIDLPEGFPKYCKVLKQIFDECQVNRLLKMNCNSKKATYNLMLDENNLKKHKDFPVQQNHHNAIEDARWNKQLYDFLQKI